MKQWFNRLFCHLTEHQIVSQFNKVNGVLHHTRDYCERCGNKFEIPITVRISSAEIGSITTRPEECQFHYIGLTLRKAGIPIRCFTHDVARGTLVKTTDIDTGDLIYQWVP